MDNPSESTSTDDSSGTDNPPPHPTGPAHCLVPNSLHTYRPPSWQDTLYGLPSESPTSNRTPRRRWCPVRLKVPSREYAWSTPGVVHPKVVVGEPLSRPQLDSSLEPRRHSSPSPTRWEWSRPRRRPRPTWERRRSSLPTPPSTRQPSRTGS